MNNKQKEVSLKMIMEEAGKMIMGLRKNTNSVLNKTKNEIVTPVDLAVNKFIIEQLKASYPDIPVYSEEGETAKSQAETRWILDPLDGTTAWVYGNSGFAISLALEVQGVVTTAAVYDPVFQEFFYSEKGKGATKNGAALHAAAGIARKDMLLVVEWGNKDGKREEGLEFFKHFFVPEMYSRRIVPLFAPALGLCHLAEGRIHGLVCNDTWVEDHSAGALILQEAGGAVSNFYHTQSFTHREAGIIATFNAEAHLELVDFLKQVVQID